MRSLWQWNLQGILWSLTASKLSWKHLPWWVQVKGYT